MSSGSLEPISGSTPAPLNFTRCHKADVVTTIVVSALLALAVGFSIHYGIHPIHPMIHTYGSFSVSLPVLVCTSAAGFLTVILVLQIARHKEINTAFAQGIGHLFKTTPLQKAFRFALHPSGRSANETPDDYLVQNDDEIAFLRQEFMYMVEMPTRDGVALRGYYYHYCLRAPTVIYFHPNAYHAEDGLPIAEMYKKMNFNVLLVEYRGYGLSEGKAAGENAEMEAYYDAEAAFRYVRKLGIDPRKIIAHGFSLGGAYAAALGYFCNVPYVILQCAFSRYADVAQRVSIVTTLETTEALVAASYQSGEAHAIVSHGKTIQTDGFDNESKARGMNSKLIVISHENDFMTPPAIGQRLFNAKSDARLLTVPKARHHPDDFLSNNQAKLQLMHYFVELGLQSQSDYENYKSVLEVE